MISHGGGRRICIVRNMIRQRVVAFVISHGGRQDVRIVWITIQNMIGVTSVGRSLGHLKTTTVKAVRHSARHLGARHHSVIQARRSIVDQAGAKPDI